MTEPSVPTTVSPASERRLRDAMKRLLTGTAVRTDGRLTKKNLCLEAKVSRATMNRATRLMAEWDAAGTERRPRDPLAIKNDETMVAMQSTVRKLREEVRDLQEQLVAAATVVATLHHENQQLKEQVPSATVSQIARPRHDATVLASRSDRRG